MFYIFHFHDIDLLHYCVNFMKKNVMLCLVTGITQGATTRPGLPGTNTVLPTAANPTSNNSNLSVCNCLFYLPNLFYFLSTDASCHYADIAFVVDTSGSIGAVNWQRLLQFVEDVVNIFRIGPSDARVLEPVKLSLDNICLKAFPSNGMVFQVGVVTFGFTAHPQFGLNVYQDKPSLINAIRNIQWLDEQTNTSGGIWYV